MSNWEFVSCTQASTAPVLALSAASRVGASSSMGASTCDNSVTKVYQQCNNSATTVQQQCNNSVTTVTLSLPLSSLTFFGPFLVVAAGFSESYAAARSCMFDTDVIFYFIAISQG
jgi:hypothetical protein